MLPGRGARPHVPAAAGTSPAASRNTRRLTTFKRIMIATDLSERSDGVWKVGTELARAVGAELVILNVEVLLYYDVPYSNIGRASEEELRAAKERLARRATEAERLGLRVTTEARTGKPADVIADTARERGVDLIVVGAHRRHRSVAEHVLRLAPCHVLTVKTTESA